MGTRAPRSTGIMQGSDLGSVSTWVDHMVGQTLESPTTWPQNRTQILTLISGRMQPVRRNFEEYVNKVQLDGTPLVLVSANPAMGWMLKDVHLLLLLIVGWDSYHPYVLTLAMAEQRCAAIARYIHAINGYWDTDLNKATLAMAELAGMAYCMTPGKIAQLSHHDEEPKDEQVK